MNINPTINPDPDHIPSELEEAFTTNPAAAKDFLVELMCQLVESDRFVTFFQLNYELQKTIDTEAKTITYQVIERPPEVVSKLMQKMMQQEQENAPKIQLANEAMLKSVTKKL